ncbi:alpha-mannosidase [candidate division KSB1 bacterium]|nr:alpha-mannosidase [candidate division KSB1 bacterium]
MKAALSRNSVYLFISLCLLCMVCSKPSVDTELTKYMEWSSEAVDGVDRLIIQDKQVQIEHLAHRPVEDDSSKFYCDLPDTGKFALTLQPVAGRGDIKLEQLPTAENGFVTKILIDDGDYGGADLYKFILYFGDPQIAAKYQKEFNREPPIVELQKMDIPLKDMTMHLVGHAHVDLSWLWSKSETIHEVYPNTYKNALDLMNNFDKFCFSASSAQGYDWVETYYPDIFAKIQERVKDGRWEIVGGAWTEHNSNIPSDESLVRQYLYGKRYFKDKFNVDVNVGWLPDCFGFNWSMPQIYNKSGIDYFMTHKLKHQENRNKPIVRFPYNNFWWLSPDGSRVLVCHTVGGYGEAVQGKKMAQQMKTIIERHKIPVLLVPYGHGDHGGGPQRDMVERAIELEQREDYPQVKFSTAEKYFDQVSKHPEAQNLPVIDDELYIKTHRGTLTTDSQVKRDNRQSEVLLTDAEKLSAIAMRFGLEYPQQELDDAWKLLLFGQVHDNLDGSSIQIVYDEAAEDYAKIKTDISRLRDRAIDKISSEINIAGGSGEPVVVFNTLSWERDGVVKLDLQANEKPGIADAAGNAVPSQIIKHGSQRTLLFIARNIPSLGYKTYWLTSEPFEASQGNSTANHLENEFLAVDVDPQTGCLSKVFDKMNQRDVLDESGKGNVLRIYEDRPPEAPSGEPAWNINLGDHTDLMQAEAIKLVENGPVRQTIRIEKKYGKSNFAQEISLYAGMPLLETRLSANWYEHYKFLKAVFPFSFSNEWATFEIPFGTVQRYDYRLKTAPEATMQHPQRKWELADHTKFEVAALKWADLSTPDNSYGVSFLNDSKYAYSFSGNTIELSLIRGPRRGYSGTPESWADQSDNPIVGTHHVAYALLPHKGDWLNANSMRAGYEFNTSLLAKRMAAHSGKLPAEYAFMPEPSANVMCTALKKAQDSNALVLRLFETAGKDTPVKLEFDQPVKRAYTTDLLEWGKYVESKNLRVAGKTVELPLNHYAVETVVLEF